MNRARLESLLGEINTTGVAVLGDFCLDAYWTIDRELSEISIETGKPTVPVRTQRYSLGGAGNIVANLAALGVGKLRAIGVLGDDLFGRELERCLSAIGADVSLMIQQSEEWAAPVYGKPYAGSEEESRIDFGVYNKLAPSTEEKLLEALESALPSVQAIIVNQQLPRGVVSERIIEGINSLSAKYPKHLFIIDARDVSGLFTNASFRINAHEAARLCGRELPVGQDVLLEDVKKFARQIFTKTRKPVFVSRGERGSVVCWAGQIEVVPGIQILKPVDAVGAGDTSASAIAAALAAGATPIEAATLANFASAVTVQKLQTTGTASPSEILELGASPDYVYRPELAGDPRAARYLHGSEIEVVSDIWKKGGVKHALFDHDGTISTLRQGWEPIMQKAFIEAILGSSYDTAPESVYRRVAERVHDYISRSTGIRTIAQMEALVEMVAEFGYVKRSEISDASGYKSRYLESLMGKVQARIEKLKKGELDVDDFTVKGAVIFLESLRARGVILYLASGTDDAYVKAEAEALGYARLFDGGIYGARDEATVDVKRVVIDRILDSRKLAGDELVCFGDGPVELRETKRYQGIAVGVASDEVRRHGLNEEKRTRLIRAGADLIIPDFTQGKALIECLFGDG